MLKRRRQRHARGAARARSEKPEERCECEFLDTAVATDSVIPDDKVAVLEMPKFAEKYLQPSAAALKESALIQSFYEGRPWQKGRELHYQYLQRKLERTLP